jgi:hypothetical protein
MNQRAIRRSTAARRESAKLDSGVTLVDVAEFGLCASRVVIGCEQK